MRQGTRIPFLMYHAIERAGSTPALADPIYSIRLEEFDRQMGYLRRAGFQAVTLSQFLAWHRHGAALPKKPVVLTFDDGHPSHLEFVLPRLTQYGFRGVFAVVAGWVGTPKSLTVENLLALQGAGMEIVSHGFSHVPLSELSTEALERELKSSKIHLERWLKRPVQTLAIPRGFSSIRVQQAAYQAGYQVICTSRPEANGMESDLYNLGRLPIKAQQTLQDFAAMVEAHPARQLWEFGGYLARRGAQKVLGAKRYDQFRQRMLGLEPQEVAADG